MYKREFSDVLEELDEKLGMIPKDDHRQQHLKGVAMNDSFMKSVRDLIAIWISDYLLVPLLQAVPLYIAWTCVSSYFPAMPKTVPIVHVWAFVVIVTIAVELVSKLWSLE